MAGLNSILIGKRKASLCFDPKRKKKKEVSLDYNSIHGEG
jgi:hypothetical protein